MFFLVSGSFVVVKGNEPSLIVASSVGVNISGVPRYYVPITLV